MQTATARREALVAACERIPFLSAASSRSIASSQGSLRGCGGELSITFSDTLQTISLNDSMTTERGSKDSLLLLPR